MLNNGLLETEKKGHALICQIVHFHGEKPLLPTLSWGFEWPFEQGMLLQGINEQDALGSIIQKSV